MVVGEKKQILGQASMENLVTNPNSQSFTGRDEHSERNIWIRKVLHTVLHLYLRQFTQGWTIHSSVVV